MDSGGSEVEVGRFVSSEGFRHHAALRFFGCPLRERFNFARKRNFLGVYFSSFFGVFVLFGAGGCFSSVFLSPFFMYASNI